MSQVKSQACGLLQQRKISCSQPALPLLVSGALLPRHAPIPESGASAVCTYVLEHSCLRNVECSRRFMRQIQIDVLRRRDLRASIGRLPSAGHDASAGSKVFVGTCSYRLGGCMALEAAPQVPI